MSTPSAAEPTPGPHSNGTDPDPADTTAVDGGVDPGDTPPASSSEPQTVAHDEPVGEARAGLPVAVLAILGVVSLSVLLFVLVRIVALFL